jgi:hypothetical protein
VDGTDVPSESPARDTVPVTGRGRVRVTGLPVAWQHMRGLEVPLPALDSVPSAANVKGTNIPSPAAKDRVPGSAWQHKAEGPGLEVPVLSAANERGK